VGDPLTLFDAAGTEGAWTVSQVTRRARAVVEQGLGPLWVRGEVTSFKAYQSGHWYFTLRDERAQLRCVMWARDNRRLRAPPVDGQQVFVLGQPTVWEERGDFRLTVAELLGTETDGAWRLAFERARAALERDGLLERARKRRLPLYPRRAATARPCAT
jgi:exodeoxyribonuclease VII large subunit